MNTRDWEYIESRLLAPCVPAMDAHERLRKYFLDEKLASQADRLMYAMQMFTDVCRDIRVQIRALQREGRG